MFVIMIICITISAITYSIKLECWIADIYKNGHGNIPIVSDSNGTHEATADKPPFPHHTGQCTTRVVVIGTGQAQMLPN